MNDLAYLLVALAGTVITLKVIWNLCELRKFTNHVPTPSPQILKSLPQNFTLYTNKDRLIDWHFLSMPKHMLCMLVYILDVCEFVIYVCGCRICLCMKVCSCVCVGQRVSVPFSIDMLLHFRQRITISLNIWLQPQVFEQASDYFELKPQTLIFRGRKLQMLG